MRTINEMTVPGKWKEVHKGEWEMDAGRGWTITVSKEGKKFRWEVAGRKHSSHGKEKSFKDAQTIGIKQYRQVKEEREFGMELDTKERFQTVGKAKLDDYGIIAKINKRNRMRAINLLNGKSPLNVPVGESVLRQRRHSEKPLVEARESSFVKKVKAMSNAQREKLSVDKRMKFVADQMEPYVQKIADQVARLINAEAKKMKITRSNMLSGKLEPNLYNAQGLLEHLIRELEGRV